ncbi:MULTISPECIES: 6-phosphogluconolactonase [Brachybacterium]|uniref:6-phosphogluconolactonase n=1 Tax=Brachybacterium alimentarium TaxID=47845 RepID=A0A2A3YMC2_9MICO|nr:MULTISPECIES: 6-phosphogluconolactonase [Brachybacterium]PCC40457.1 6-phosphogluconolactonase [Brachybacterium alimentarium]RCS67024.1 6-phosphogluconolactonase [Brachybacterium sp. JB7]RCS76955.1 6-phosphogluconolactonase [Brachybacterium alimentarium]RCS78803.1 6-phosphogluconolactonase [Brachybacterium alimentarium]RCS84205.1 6-phosphogluconolactonase [Brachybacterium alimentarium]
MITTLTDTTASAIDKKMIEMRETFGANTIGRVLTLIIIATGDIEEPLEAAISASHEHPARVLVVDADPEAEVSGLDAEIRVGRDAGAGEIVILRARGDIMSSLDTLVMALLLPDAPIVTWWPEGAPSAPVHDVLGSMSQRRITDSAACPAPIATLKRLRRGYSHGDSDLAWARLTRWRGLVASAYEVPPVSVPKQVQVAGSAENPSVVLMAAWLSHTLGVDAKIVDPSDDAPDYAGVHGVRLLRADGTIDLTRVSDEAIVLTLPTDDSGQHVTMPRRTLNELLAEELRRLDPDEVYGEVLASTFSDIVDSGTFATGKPAPTDTVVADADAVAVAAAESAASQLATALKERSVAHLVVTGGTVGTKTAGALPAALRSTGADLTHLHIWWGDERFVDPESADRNEVAVRAGLLEPLQEAGLPSRNIHVMPSPADGMSLEDAAAWYGQQLDLLGGDEPFRTRGGAFFDVLMLGVGPDGHVASLFPEHPDQRQVGASAIAVKGSPKPPSERVSLTWPVLNSSRHVALLVAGGEKADAVADGHGEIDPWPVPASAVRGLETTTWFLDTAAASRLKG